MCSYDCGLEFIYNSIVTILQTFVNSFAKKASWKIQPYFPKHRVVINEVQLKV